MRHLHFPAAFLIAVCIAATGCDTSSPSGPGPLPARGNLSSSNVDLPAGPNSVKATVPTMVSPAAGEVLSGSQLVLRATNAVSTHVAGVPLEIEFELWDISDTARLIAASPPLPQNPGGSTSWAPGVSLRRDAEHRARARARYEGAVGAWSSAVVFTGKSFLGLDEIDAYDIAYLHTNIADWPQTSVITGITMGPSQICVFHTGANRFPVSTFGEIQVEGNVWVFAPINGRWYGATWDWLRPGQQCKGENKYQLGPDQIRIPPMNTWIPESGSPICFAVSARARDGVPAGQERSNIACTTTSP